MRKKKILLSLASAFLLFGAAMNIMNAINNYGLATNSLHSEILAQTNGDPGDGENTGDTGGKTTGNGTSTTTPDPQPGIMTGAHQASEVKRTTRLADSNGKVSYAGSTDPGTWDAGTEYIIEYRHYYCVRDKSNDTCNPNNVPKDEFLGVVGAVTGSGTGTGTNGDNNPTPPQP